MGALLIGSVIVALGWGAVSVGPGQIVAIFLAKAGLAGNGIDAPATFGATFTTQQLAVVWNIRLPRVLLAVAAGAGLAMAGAAMQSAFRNQLADPTLLGISGAAATGVLLAIVAGVSAVGGGAAAGIAQAVAAVVAAVVVALWLERFASRHGRGDVVTIVLAGVALQMLLAAVNTALVFGARVPGLQGADYWTLGGLGGTLWIDVAIALPAVVAVAVGLVFIAPRLNLILLGDAEARHLGVNVRLTRLLALALGAGVSGVIVSTCGTLGFIGLVVPYLLRRWLGPDNRRLLPAVALGGAVFVVLADALARNLIVPMELPLSIITTVVGAPLLFFLIDRGRRVGGS
ncbi:MAG: iron ABC transporter permease [Trueperaceae bacterium]|nr:iron ABC transporter permease [Trueperaceae bacterium]